MIALFTAILRNIVVDDGDIHDDNHSNDDANDDDNDGDNDDDNDGDGADGNNNNDDNDDDNDDDDDGDGDDDGDDGDDDDGKDDVVMTIMLPLTSDHSSYSQCGQAFIRQCCFFFGFFLKSHMLSLALLLPRHTHATSRS